MPDGDENALQLVRLSGKDLQAGGIVAYDAVSNRWLAEQMAFWKRARS